MLMEAQDAPEGSAAWLDGMDVDILFEVLDVEDPISVANLVSGHGGHNASSSSTLSVACYGRETACRSALCDPAFVASRPASDQYTYCLCTCYHVSCALPAQALTQGCMTLSVSSLTDNYSDNVHQSLCSLQHIQALWVFVALAMSTCGLSACRWAVPGMAISEAS